MEWVRPDGPVQAGVDVVMKPIGQDPIRSTIAAVDEGCLYADETVFEDAVLRFSHTLSPAPSGGTEVAHRLEVTGVPDDVAAEIGEAVTADFPEAMAGLLSLAAGRA